MFAKHFKSTLVYALILACGLGAGYAVPKVYQWMTPTYTEGDFSAYYPDGRTNVVLYGTPTCPYCVKAREYLTAKKIVFVDYDLSSSAKGQAEFEKLGGSKVPMILVGKRQLIGFQKADLDAALVKAGHPDKS